MNSYEFTKRPLGATLVQSTSLLIEPTLTETNIVIKAIINFTTAIVQVNMNPGFKIDNAIVNLA